MNIAIDIDDTLTDSFVYFQPMVSEFFDIPLAFLRENDISYSNLPIELKPRELDFCKKYYDRTVVNTPFKEGASESVKKLINMGHRVVIITGRTTAFYTDPYKTTADELAAGNIPYDKLICTLDKGKACVDEKIDLIIDDLESNLDTAAALGIKTLLFESKANKKIKSRHKRVSDWGMVVDTVNNI